MFFLQTTGVTRKIDELGRIVIPKEIRRNLGIRDGECLEIFTDIDKIILKKHSQIKNYEELSNKLCEIINGIYDIDVYISDREKIIATSNDSVILNKKITDYLISLIDNRNIYLSNSIGSLDIEDIHIEGYFSIVPIIASSDSVGLVIINSNKEQTYEKLAKLIAKILADKVNIC